MTIDRDRLHALADETGRGYIQLSGGMLAGLLDALTRAEAQAAIRGRAVAIYQRRAREAETERDWNWRSSRHSKIERIKANARADRAEAEARKGDRGGQHSIRINDQWRICFVWTDAGPEEVQIVDCH